MTSVKIPDEKGCPTVKLCSARDLVMLEERTDILYSVRIKSRMQQSGATSCFCILFYLKQCNFCLETCSAGAKALIPAVFVFQIHH